MAKYGCESKHLHAHFFEVMENHEAEDVDGESIFDLMKDIDALLDICYFLGINPLRELRKTLPQYSWQYHVSKDRRAAAETVANSDFIWRVDLPEELLDNHSEEVALVTATKTDRTKHRKLFFAGEKNQGEPSTDFLDFVRALGGDPVYSVILDEEWIRTPEGQKWLDTPHAQRSEL